MNQSQEQPFDSVLQETAGPSVNTGDALLSYSPYRSSENLQLLQNSNLTNQQRETQVSFLGNMPDLLRGGNQQFDFSQFFGNQQQLGPQFQLGPQHHFGHHHQFGPQHQFGPGAVLDPRRQMAPNYYQQDARFTPQDNRFSPFQFEPRFDPRFAPRFDQQYDDFADGEDGYQERDFPPPHHRPQGPHGPQGPKGLDRPYRPDRPDRAERPDRPERDDRQANESTSAARFRQAVERANSGGRPLRVVHYGDSHSSKTALPETIKSELNRIAPTDFQVVAKGGVMSNYPLIHKAEWLDRPLRDRQPDLVILTFGSNDAGNPYNDSQFRNRYQRLIDEIKSRAPNTAILVVGAGDGYYRGRELAGIDGVVRTQRELAQKNGLMFFDLRQYMGGPGSINRWRQEGLAFPDRLHFGPSGYRKIGTATIDSLREQAGVRNRRTQNQLSERS